MHALCANFYLIVNIAHSMSRSLTLHSPIISFLCKKNSMRRERGPAQHPYALRISLNLWYVFLRIRLSQQIPQLIFFVCFYFCFDGPLPNLLKMRKSTKTKSLTLKLHTTRQFHLYFRELSICMHILGIFSQWEITRFLFSLHLLPNIRSYLGNKWWHLKC